MWWDYADNPAYLKALYDVAPSLGQVEILNMHLGRDGPSLELNFSTECLPVRPPVKWGEFDRVTFRIRLFDIRNLSVTKFGRAGFSRIGIEKLGAFLNVEVEGAVTMFCSAKYLDVVTITGYQHTESDA
ncbi:Imm50 family immunity protein [Phyllobacterium sp. 22552]|uniref:Imm50 family immunity protein n=1 Tax=Phyllobacterium sp. 22552 TaxID=3453941 RepID=UPI003F8797C7